MRGSKVCREWTLQNGAQATSTGTWVNISSLTRCTAHVTGITVATVQLYGSCEPTIPADSTDGVKLGSDITTNTIYETTAKLKYVKAKISAYTSGTIYVYLVGDERVRAT